MIAEPTVLDVLELAADLIASGCDGLTEVATAVRRLGLPTECPVHKQAYAMITDYHARYPHLPAGDRKLTAILDAIQRLRAGNP